MTFMTGKFLKCAHNWHFVINPKNKTIFGNVCTSTTGESNLINLDHMRLDNQSHYRFIQFMIKCKDRLSQNKGLMECTKLADGLFIH